MYLLDFIMIIIKSYIAGFNILFSYILCSDWSGFVAGSIRLFIRHFSIFR